MTTTNAFNQLPLNPELLRNLKALGYEEMTPVQAQCLPLFLAQNDLIVQAKTGSGKTAVFGIGMLSRIDLRSPQLQALVLCPTRELADQVASEIRRLAKFAANVKILTLCGGKPLRPQALSLAFGAHIVVGTPGRIQDHLQKGNLNLRAVKILVLDEGDQMLNLGFKEDITAIVKHLPADRQSLLFSATYPPAIAEISQAIQKSPLMIKVESHHSPQVIQQSRCLVTDEQDRLSKLKAILRRSDPTSAIVFCATKEQCRKLAQELKQAGFKALALHGDLEQRERDDVLVLFANKSCSILVATDVASRGLHISSVDMVVNYHVPKDPSVYVHRIGRTGRAGNKGHAVSLYEAKEKHKIEAIETHQKMPLALENLATSQDHLGFAAKAVVVTLKIAGGKRNKISKGDILGALTHKQSGLTGANVGKIDIFEFHSCVAVDAALASNALDILENRPIKGKAFKVQRM